MELENLVTGGKQRINLINTQIASGKDIYQQDLTEFQKEQLIQERAQALATLHQIADAEDTSGADGRTTGGLNTSYAKARKVHMENVGFKDVNGLETIRDPRDESKKLTGNDAIKAWKESVNEWNISWITTNILDKDGKVKSTAAQDTINENMLMDQLALAQERIQEAKSAEGKGDETIEEPEGKSEAAFTPTPLGTEGFIANSVEDANTYIRDFPEQYVAGAMQAGVPIDRNRIEAKLKSLGVSEDAINRALALIPVEADDRG